MITVDHDDWFMLGVLVVLLVVSGVHDGHGVHHGSERFSMDS